MANKIQIRRGLKTNLPSLDVGEPALCTDTREVYIGNTGENVQLVSKEMLNGILGNYTLQIPYAVAEGSANSYAVTLSPEMKGYIEGVAVAVKINVTNTAASTINICGLGAKSIMDSKGNAVTAGKLVANSIYTLRYNGTNFILQGEGGEYTKKWASGTVTPTTAGTYIMDGGSNAGCYSATVSGLTFKPSFVVLYDAEDIDMTIYSGLGQMGDGGSKIIAGIGSQVSSYYSGTVIKLANLAVISNTGFTLPTWKNKEYTWIAYE